MSSTDLVALQAQRIQGRAKPCSQLDIVNTRSLVSPAFIPTRTQSSHRIGRITLAVGLSSGYGSPPVSSDYRLPVGLARMPCDDAFLNSLAL